MVNYIVTVEINPIIVFVIFTVIKRFCHRKNTCLSYIRCLEMYVNQQAGGKAFPLFDDRVSLLVLPDKKRAHQRIVRFFPRFIFSVLFSTNVITISRLVYQILPQKSICRGRIHAIICVVLSLCDNSRQFTFVHLDAVHDVLW